MIRPALLSSFIFIILLTLTLTSFAQESEGEKTAAKIGLFYLPGFEPPAKPKSHLPDTANFKPQNFSFPNINRQSLTARLETNIPLPPVDCKPSWGLFAFRVNAAGKVDSTWYRGSLPLVASDKILANIRATEGLWIIKPSTKPTDVAWFLYPFFDTRGRLERKYNCSEADIELLKAVSSLSNLVFNLYYQVDNNHNRATLIMPTERDGMPKL